ncbi:hypothetical protein KQX54_004509 [Cotesia glomerata]|uniref:Uncharacterized protein n=1 Tax=Cotesia glomerata TaxID=32391 RepID=A0AAV7J292_COTGL|nr:hypothetical protein KQX54_004509 [Cotesia glomerata]
MRSRNKTTASSIRYSSNGAYYNISSEQSKQKIGYRCGTHQGTIITEVFRTAPGVGGCRAQKRERERDGEKRAERSFARAEADHSRDSRVFTTRVEDLTLSYYSFSSMVLSYTPDSFALSLYQYFSFAVACARDRTLAGSSPCIHPRSDAWARLRYDWALIPANA